MKRRVGGFRRRAKSPGAWWVNLTQDGGNTSWFQTITASRVLGPAALDNVFILSTSEANMPVGLQRYVPSTLRIKVNRIMLWLRLENTDIVNNTTVHADIRVVKFPYGTPDASDNQEAVETMLWRQTYILPVAVGGTNNGLNVSMPGNPRNPQIIRAKRIIRPSEGLVLNIENDSTVMGANIRYRCWVKSFLSKPV